MTLGDWLDIMKLEDIKIVIETVQEYNDTKENAVGRLRAKFPECAEQAEEFVDRYWKEN